MKAFSLEEYLKNPSRKVIQRDGHNVRIICTDHDNVSYPIVGAIKGYKFPYCFSEDGCVVGSKCNDANDLFFASEKHEGWVIISKLPFTDSFEIFPEIFATKEEAVRVWEDNPGIKCSIIKIEWEVEQ